jgi:anaerobic ribonucleoside-triphosphate reductase activating protein
LYSGEKYIDISISQHLNLLKTGAWQQELGGLESTTTNQVFRNVNTGEKLNHLFTHKNNNLEYEKITQGASNVAA